MATAKTAPLAYEPHLGTMAILSNSGVPAPAHVVMWLRVCLCEKGAMHLSAAYFLSLKSACRCLTSFDAIRVSAFGVVSLTGS